jgi:beta-glucanase (GH16 family)
MRATHVVSLLLVFPIFSVLALSGCSGGDTEDGAGGSAGAGAAGGAAAGGGTGGNGGLGGAVPVDCGAAIGFEDGCGPFDLEGFGGGAVSILDNPDRSGVNTTARVVRMQKFEGEVFGGAVLDLARSVDWTEGTAFTMKVWSARPADVLFKLEGLEEEITDVHTGSSRWEETCYDFAGLTEGPDATAVTVIFDLGEMGDAASDPDGWTFYYDEIQQTDTCAADDVTYELVFADEFDSGTTPLPGTWNIETGYGPGGDGWGNNEWQLYTDSPDNVRVEDGNLVISALCPEEPCGVRDGTVTSARINSAGKFEFRYGRVEARIKPPVGRAAWPAFWALGANFPTIGWPRSGEIDFMEMHNAFSNERTTHFTIHWCDQSVQAPETCSFPEGRVFYTRNRTFEDSLGDDFHIFEAEWDETQIVGKIDGLVYFTKAIKPDLMEEFRRDFFLIFNVAMGGTLGSNNQPPSGAETFPQTMLVDYVRVYRRVEDSN